MSQVVPSNLQVATARGRSEDNTRKRVLKTAIGLFGSMGFEGANTRDIARHAGTTMSSITYHFGSKHGLYLAAADHVAACVSEYLAPSLDHYVDPPMDRKTAVDALLSLLDLFAQMMLSDESAAWSQFIMREQQKPSEAFARLYDGAMRRVQHVLGQALKIARHDLNDAEVKASGILLLGQAMILRSSRNSVAQVLGVAEFDQYATTLIRERLRANTLCIVNFNSV